MRNSRFQRHPDFVHVLFRGHDHLVVLGAFCVRQIQANYWHYFHLLTCASRSKCLQLDWCFVWLGFRLHVNYCARGCLAMAMAHRCRCLAYCFLDYLRYDFVGDDRHAFHDVCVLVWFRHLHRFQFHYHFHFHFYFQLYLCLKGRCYHYRSR